MRRKKRLVPLSVLLQDDCLGDFAAYADSFYIDVKALSDMKRQKGQRQARRQKT